MSFLTNSITMPVWGLLLLCIAVLVGIFLIKDFDWQRSHQQIREAQAQWTALERKLSDQAALQLLLQQNPQAATLCIWLLEVAREQKVCLGNYLHSYDKPKEGWLEVSALANLMSNHLDALTKEPDMQELL